MPLVDTLTVTAQDPRRAKLEGGKPFRLVSEFQPAGDQPTAIAELVEGIAAGERNQVLLGATGTGKTFTAAKVIEATQRPAIILAPNKTLAAQLYGEFKGFFPENAVEYFVSYYDYYQPEAYVPRTDTYIEKESQINEQIDRMRHSATRALLERDDVIIVASVSCIYGIGSAETYGAMTQDLVAGRAYRQREVISDLVTQQYRRNDAGFQRGNFRVRGDSLEIWPAHLEDRAWRLSLLRRRARIDPRVRPADRRPHRLARPGPRLRQLALRDAAPDAEPGDQGHPRGAAPAPRPARRRGQARSRRSGSSSAPSFDLEMLEATGSCNGIENYSRYLTGPQARRAAADALRVHPRQRHRLRRREPRQRAADRRHVPRRLPPQVHPRRARLPPALLHGQPPAEVRGVGRDAPAVGLRLGHPRGLGARADRRRLRRAGDPPDRPRRPAGRDPPGLDAGRRPARRDPQGRRRTATARSSPC